MTEWDGRPLNPERDGWHWLRRAHDGRGICRSWSAKEKGWLDGITLSPATVVEWGVGYLGPALLPAEVAAREAAAFKRGAEAMREACAAFVMCGCDTAEQARVVVAATTEGPNSAARWRACHRSDCLALIAAEVLDLPLPGDAT